MLEEPTLRWQEPRLDLGVPPLRLGAELEATMAWIRQLLDPDFLRRALLRLDPALTSSSQPPPWLQAPTLPQPQPLVPPGAGPATPRPASAGDVLGAIMAVPAVRTTVDHLRDEALGRLQRDWRGLSTGEAVAVITTGVVIPVGALTGIVLNSEAREFALQQLQGKTLPVPGLPMTLRLDPLGPDQRLMLNLDLGALLPATLGFGSQ